MAIGWRISKIVAHATGRTTANPGNDFVPVKSDQPLYRLRNIFHLNDVGPVPISTPQPETKDLLLAAAEKKSARRVMKVKSV